MLLVGLMNKHSGCGTQTYFPNATNDDSMPATTIIPKVIDNIIL